MSRIRQKQPRLRLDVDAYRQLCREILECDGWRCQACGARQDLQVHHQQFRSHSGNDSEANLVTLCDRCHRLVHDTRQLNLFS